MAIPNTTGLTVENPYLEAQNATYRAIHVVDGHCLQTHLEAIWNWKVLVQEMIAQKRPALKNSSCTISGWTQTKSTTFSAWINLTQPNFSANSKSLNLSFSPTYLPLKKTQNPPPLLGPPFPDLAFGGICQDAGTTTHQTLVQGMCQLVVLPKGWRFHPGGATRWYPVAYLFFPTPFFTPLWKYPFSHTSGMKYGPNTKLSKWWSSNKRCLVFIFPPPDPLKILLLTFTYWESLGRHGVLISSSKFLESCCNLPHSENLRTPNIEGMFMWFLKQVRLFHSETSSWGSQQYIGLSAELPYFSQGVDANFQGVVLVMA